MAAPSSARGERSCAYSAQCAATEHAHHTDGPIVRDLGLREDFELRRGAPQKARQQIAQCGRHQQHCRLTKLLALLRDLRDLTQQAFGETGLHPGALRTSRLTGLREHLLELRLERVHLELARTAEHRLQNGTRQRDAYRGGKLVRILRT